MGIEHRIAYATSFQLERSPYKPGVLPLQGEPSKGSGHTHDAFLEPLKAREIHERRKGVLHRTEIRNAVELAQASGISRRILTDSLTIIRRRTRFLATSDELYRLFHKPLYSGQEEPKRLADTVNVDWDTPYVLNGVSVLGVYLHTGAGGRILIASSQATAGETLESVALHGEFPPPTQTLIHEKTHAVQYNFVPAGNIPREFIEAQARRTKQTSISEKPHEDLVNDVISSPAYKDLNRRKFESAVWVIDRLNALGLTQEQIVYLTSTPGRWNEEEGHWENLDRKINAIMRRKRLDEEGLERLVIAHDLKATIARHQARHITQSILSKQIQRGTRSERQQGIAPGRKPSARNRHPNRRRN